MWWWTAIGLIVAIYCLTRAVEDVRQKRYVWAAIGFGCAALILFLPVQTHAVKVDLPVAT
jgi:hypothetical protein